jgi:hypothetical protein
MSLWSGIWRWNGNRRSTSHVALKREGLIVRSAQRGDAAQEPTSLPTSGGARQGAVGGDVRIRAVRVLLLSIFLAGCETSPTLQSLKDLGKYFSPGSSTATAAPALNPAYRYLRIQTGKQVAYFARGYVDPLPEGKVEVWYSGGKEVLKLLDGRVVGMVGTATEWLSVKLISPPTWGDKLDGMEYERRLDISPGYRYGVRERLRLKRLPPPSDTKLAGLKSQDIVWYREVPVGPSAVPSALYGLMQEGDAWRVVYSEVCLDTNLCFSWQRWKS